MARLKWESTTDCRTARAKVVGGWLIRYEDEVMTTLPDNQYPAIGLEWRSSMVFIPDPEHTWDIIDLIVEE